MKSVAVIGSGITGLATAYRLNKLGFQVTVLEKKDSIGGVIQTVFENGFIAESGPNTMRVLDEELDHFLKEINIENKIIETDPRIKRRFVVKKGKPVPLPQSPFSLITSPLFSALAKLRLLQEPLIKKRTINDEECLADFTRRRLGKEALDYAINPLAAGVYAGDPEKLSAKYAFPLFYNLENEYGSLIIGGVKSRRKSRGSHPPFKKRIVSFKKGMGTLGEAIALNLTHPVQTGIEITSINKKDKWNIIWKKNEEHKEDIFDALVTTTPTHSMASLPFDKNISSSLDQLGSIPYTPVSILVFGFKREHVQHPLDGFGMLVPEKEKMNILGTLFTSSVFPSHAPEGHVLLTTFIGGARQPDVVTAPLDEQKSLVINDLDQLLGIKGDPVYFKQFHWHNAIPQFNIGHNRYLEIIEEIESDNPNLYISGSYRTGVAVGKCLLAGLSTADKINLSLST